ncbi:glutathione S-transferase 1-like isoform X2 [Leguminivora glycinivorella]|uniref:glutathione S-transferase 1-like isoform X2 n=2 Tax=Leguminivora glycinivorella TaxID=1035111 RepID=UPI00200E723A|nr:glutathione S-transferase 1-like isoform X2 [Leguminivora glycinivorella]
MVKLYKLDASPPARACMVACELLAVRAELVDVNLLQGEHLQPEFLKINPIHTIPVLEDGGLAIHDSHAILMYLADAYGKQESLYPREPRQRALVNQKLFFNSSILFPRLRNITYPLIIEGVKEIPQKGLDAIEEAYGFLEEFLSRSRHLAGDDVTIADIAAYATVTSLELLLPLNAQKYPKTQAWLKALEKLPAVQKCNAKGVEDLKQFINSKLA